MSEQRIADARLAEIAAILDQYKERTEYRLLVGSHTLSSSDLADLCADLADARAARGLPRAEWANLRGYLVHGSRCGWKRSGPCDCGLVAALRAFLRAARPRESGAH